VAFRVETGILNPDTDQYAGDGGGKAGLARVGAEAARLEGLGFDGLCAPEAGHDAFLPLAIAAGTTSRVALGTNVAIAFPRAPMVTAQLAWDLQEYSGGRFNLGLGTQVKGHNVLRYAAPWTAAPGPRMRDYIRCLKAMFASFATGKVEPFESEHYTFKLLPPFFNPGPIGQAAPPIYIAAVNKYMCRLVGELCDGVRLHPIGTFAYTREVVLVGAELHRLSKEGKWKEMPALITDEMLDEWAISATWDQLGAAFKTRCEGVFDTLMIDMPAKLAADEDRVRDILAVLK
jgi:alkanesulfonate monooxygenase SsuD/methylene tetrahydromethanopterin reductase-like flavin-dependent oxidoreductase (luciferase family)